jgi:dGTPase
VREQAQHRLRVMFEGFVKNPHLLPEKFRSRGANVGLARSVGDYLAGMTDRFCDEQFRRYFAESAGG